MFYIRNFDFLAILVIFGAGREILQIHFLMVDDINESHAQLSHQNILIFSIN